MPESSKSPKKKQPSKKATARKGVKKRAASKAPNRKAVAKKRPVKKRPAVENPRKNPKRRWWWMPSNKFQDWVFDRNGPKWFERLGAFFIRVMMLGVLGFSLMVAFYSIRANYQPIETIGQMAHRTILVDRQGKEIGQLHGENRILVAIEEVSPYMQQAILAREDVRFYEHGGVDWLGVMRAAFRNVKDRQLTQGASTITMQLSRNSFELGRGNALQELDRKFLEIAVSKRLESELTKNEILELYLNRIFWGHNIYGVESAARTYFRKTAEELTLAESAMLAGIIRGPNLFSPFRSIERANKEKRVVLGRMLEERFITEGEYKQALVEEIFIAPHGERGVVGGYALDAIGRNLKEVFSGDLIDDGGLRVQTTLDLEIQNAAEKAVFEHLEEIESSLGYVNPTRLEWLKKPKTERGAPDYIQGACVVIENATGNVLAMVGGRSFEESQYNRAIQARRQIGSIFKPFVFLAAMDNGIRRSDWVSDERLKVGEIAGAPRNWNPRNSDGMYHEKVSVAQALIQSRNTSSIRVGNTAGLSAVQKVAHDAGFLGRVKQGKVSGLPDQASIYLGAWEASPWEVASAYSIFPCGGERNRPHLIQSILNTQGDEILPTGNFKYRAASESSSLRVTSLLERVVNEGTGRRIRSSGIEFPAAGKTGTTNDFRDGWFAGYTETVTCAVWVGMDNNAKTMEKGYGSTLALPIWIKIMKSVEKSQRYSMGVLTEKTQVVEPSKVPPNGKNEKKKRRWFDFFRKK